MGRRLRRSGTGPLRTAVFWMHLAAGTVAGVVVLIMSATGVLLAYERQVLEWAARRYEAVPPTPAARRLPLDTVLARARAAAGGRPIVSLGVRADDRAPVAIGFENRRNLFVDPYTAEAVGDDAAARTFFAGVQRWHRWLAIGSTPRSPIGKAITGAANLAFLFLILSGLYLWWPRQPSGRAFRAVTLFSWESRGKARDWNWHHVLGFWSAPALILIVASATFISYAWPGDLTRRAFGERAARTPEREGGGGERGRAGGESRGEGRGGGREGRPSGPSRITASLDGMLSVAARREPAWRSIQIRLPQAPTRPVSVTVSTGGARPDARSQGTFDATTGVMREWQTYADGSAFRRFRSWIRPIHTGEAGGLLGQTIAALVSAAAVVLVWTGIALACRRLLAARGRRVKAPALRQAA
jgi:uncharacterized iron-regulated membrane protein